MKLPKIPIDYSKAGSGQAPFDGEAVILFSGDTVIGECIWACSEEFAHMDCQCDNCGHMPTFNKHYATHYTPIPEFEEVK